MPERILYVLLHESTRRASRRQQQIDKMLRGQKLTAMMAIPPYWDE